MSEKPWELTDVENQPRNYVFSNREREFCATGDSGGYKPSQLRNQIKNKRLRRLPTRFQDLFDDITLAHHADEEFLTDPEWHKLWWDLLNTHSRFNNLPGENITFTEHEQSNEHVQFGFRLGSTIRLLKRKHEGGVDDYPTPELAASESPSDPWYFERAELVWGFLLGLLGEPYTAASTEADRLSDVIDQLSRRRCSRSQKMKSLNDKKEKQDAEDTERASIIKSCLHSNGIAALPKHINYLDGDYPMHWPQEILSVHFEHQLRKDRLFELEPLRWDIEHDMREIEDHSPNNREAIDVLEQLWQLPGPQPSARLALSTNRANIVSTIMFRLSAEHVSELWTIRPIVRGDPDGWTFTDYGKLVANGLFDRDRSALWVYWFTLAPDSLTDTEHDLLQSVLDSPAE